jgi:hypothetical protein
VILLQNITAKLFGYLLGDGWLASNGNTCGFSGDKDGLLQLKEDLFEVFGNTVGKAIIRTRVTTSPKK